MAKKTEIPTEDNSGTMTFTSPEPLNFQEPKHEVAPMPETSPLMLLDRAVMNGAAIDTLERLMALYERYEAKKAEKAFNAAMGQFQKDRPRLKRRATANVTSKDPNKSGYKYKYAEMDEIVEGITQPLYNNGFSYSFKPSNVKGENGESKLRITCIIAHKDGHKEETYLEAPMDDSGGKNKIQGIGSTASYLERYTLKAALGLTDADDDNDGATSGAKDNGDEVVAGSGPKATPENVTNAVKYIVMKGQSEYDRALQFLSFDRKQMKALDTALNAYNKAHPAA